MITQDEPTPIKGQILLWKYELISHLQQQWYKRQILAMTLSFINILGARRQIYKGIFELKLHMGRLTQIQRFAENPHRMPEVAF